MPSPFDEGPFGGPFNPGAQNIGGSPLDSEDNTIVRCPTCKSQEFRAYTNQFGLFRHCNDCGQEWTGGTMAVARPLFLDPPPPDGIPAPDDDLPAVQYTGASFRDPSKNFGDDDY